MSSNGVIVTPVEQHKSLLNQLFKFKPASKLHEYVIKRGNTNKKYFTLAEILSILRDAIRGEGLYDENNPSIIICSSDLEHALDMKALHVTEIRDLVLSHMTKIEDEAFLSRYFSQTTNSINNVSVSVSQSSVSPAQRLIHTANISTQVVTDKQAKFKVKPKFLEVLRSLPSTDQKKTVFTYEEVTLLLSTYILEHKTKFFDTRNIKLAIVKGDPLGDAFGVTAFHRCQVNNLLRGQLIPYDPSCPDLAVVTSSSSSPGCSVAITENPVPIVSSKGVAGTPENLRGSAAGIVLPPFPALSKARTLPAGFNSLVRKRSDSDDEAEEMKSKQSRTMEFSNVVVTRARSHSDCDTETETIYSAQSTDTIAANDKIADDDEVESEEEEEDVNEYEPESCEEEERPPQAMGRLGDFSNSDSSDSADADDIIIDLDAKKKGEKAKKESVYWGDSENEKELDSYDSELEPADLWTCVGCKKPNKPYIRFCQSCWKIRKGWVGSYDRKRKRKNNFKVTSHDSDTETDGTGDKEDKRPRMDSQDSGIGSGESQELELTTLNNQFKPILNRSTSVRSSVSSGSTLSLDSGYQSTSTAKSATTSHLCLLCCHRSMDAALVHGNIGHQVSCYPCAKKLWRKRGDCPMCRRTVEKIIKIIPGCV